MRRRFDLTDFEWSPIEPLLMPLVARCSSTRALPRVPVGRCGAIHSDLLRGPGSQTVRLLKPLYGSGP
jgi:transposase